MLADKNFVKGSTFYNFTDDTIYDRILDKNIVLDPSLRQAQMQALDLLTTEARIVTASVDTYLNYACESQYDNLSLRDKVLSGGKEQYVANCLKKISNTNNTDSEQKPTEKTDADVANDCGLEWDKLAIKPRDPFNIGKEMTKEAYVQQCFFNKTGRILDSEPTKVDEVPQEKWERFKFIKDFKVYARLKKKYRNDRHIITLDYNESDADAPDFPFEQYFNVPKKSKNFKSGASIDLTNLDFYNKNGTYAFSLYVNQRFAIVDDNVISK